jgi:hypothetical protein
VTTYARREVVVRRFEFAIAAGSNIGVFDRVKAIAWQNYCEMAGFNPNASQGDDWCTVIPRDDEVVLAFTVEEIQPKGGAQ